MKLDYVIIYVGDVVAAAQFYERAFGLRTAFVHESNMYAEMDTGSTTLAFAQTGMLKMNTGIEAQEPGNSFEIALSDSDPSAVYERAVSSGAEPVKAAEQKPWGQTVAYVRDPFGTLVEICTPIKR